MIRIFVCYSKTNKYLSHSWLREAERRLTNLNKILEIITPTPTPFQLQIFQNGSFSFPTGK